jgi:hypothetical protein
MFGTKKWYGRGSASTALGGRHWGRRWIATTVAAATIFALAGPAPSASAETTSESTGTPYLVTFASGTTAAEQAAALSDAGATDLSAIPQLRMHQVDVPVDSSAASDRHVSLPRVEMAEGASAQRSSPSGLYLSRQSRNS